MTVLAILVGLALAMPALAGVIRPKTLLVYYGYPTSINRTFSVQAAALDFGRYDYVVWGDGLDDPGHPDHANAVAIIAQASMASTKVFGYVDLGVITQNLPIAEVQARIARWQAMGVDGVLMDDFGYDFGTGRQRQNAAVAYAHGAGLAVIANAFRPEDAFGGAVDPLYNPSGAATALGATDFYLYESHAVRLGDYEDGAAWRAKADAIEAHRQALGFRVLSITTTATDDVGAYDEPHFFYAWYAALLFGHEATGWGEYGFSASGASNGLAPFRARPTLDPGNAFACPVAHLGSRHARWTDLGLIETDTAAHSFGFSVDPTGVGVGSGPISRPFFAAAPNPMRAETRLSFTLARTAAVRLAVFDVHGRRIATLVSGELGAGRHERRWPSRDPDGHRVAAGLYFATLDVDGRRSTVTLVRVQ